MSYTVFMNRIAGIAQTSRPTVTRRRVRGIAQPRRREEVAPEETVIVTDNVILLGVPAATADTLMRLSHGSNQKLA